VTVSNFRGVRVPPVPGEEGGWHRRQSESYRSGRRSTDVS
jgi:hypothetical protein